MSLCIERRTSAAHYPLYRCLLQQLPPITCNTWTVKSGTHRGNCLSLMLATASTILLCVAIYCVVLEKVLHPSDNHFIFYFSQVLMTILYFFFSLFMLTCWEQCYYLYAESLIVRRSLRSKEHIAKNLFDTVVDSRILEKKSNKRNDLC